MAKTPAKKPPKRTPKHGRGKLYAGGVPGNKGGGRPPDEIRERFRDLGWRIADELQRRLDHEPDTDRKRLKKRTKDQLIARILELEGLLGMSHKDIKGYLDILSKYGIGQKFELEGKGGGPLVVAIAGPEHPTDDEEDDE